MLLRSPHSRLGSQFFWFLRTTADYVIFILLTTDDIGRNGIACPIPTLSFLYFRFKEKNPEDCPGGFMAALNPVREFY